MTSVRYLTAAQWGGTWSGTPAVETLLDPEVYVHHIGAPNAPWPIDDAIAQFRQLNTYAQNVKGYSFLDYDVLTHYSRGQDVITIGEGRGKYRSAATLDRNEQGEAVLACGNFDLRDPLPQEVEGVALGVKFGMDNGWISKAATGSWIRGHRDNPAHPNATSCPGGRMYAKLPAVRAMVTELLGVPPVVVPPTPPGVPRFMKYGGTPTANWGAWYSFDGVTRQSTDWAGAQHLSITLQGLDAKTGLRPKDPENWTDVSHTTSVAELDKYLIPNKPAPPPPSTGGHVLLYKVRDGDSYWKICETVYADGKATNTRVSAIQSANANVALKPGMIINIPGRVA